MAPSEFGTRPGELGIERVDVGDGEVRLVLRGEVDVATAHLLRQRIVDLLADGSNRLQLDLGQLAFIDSTGLGVIVGGMKRARATGGDLTVVAASARVRRVLQVTGLDRLIRVDDPPE